MWAYTNGKSIFLFNGIYLANGEKSEGLKRLLYQLWDQNENMKLNKGPNDLISQKEI